MQKKWIEMEDKYSFLEKHFKKGLECIIDFDGDLKKHNKVWISDNQYIIIKVTDNLIELKANKKNSLVLFYITDLFKMKDYEGCEMKNYEIKINNEIIMKIDEGNKIEEFIKHVINGREMVTIKIIKEEDDLEFSISFDSPDYETGYLEKK